MVKRIILLGLLLIALMASGCVWYGGHGHGRYSRDYPRDHHHHDHDGGDRHPHGGGYDRW